MSHRPGYMPYAESPDPSELAPPANNDPPVRRGFCRFWRDDERCQSGAFIDEHTFLQGQGFVCPRDAG